MMSKTNSILSGAPVANSLMPKIGDAVSSLSESLRTDAFSSLFKNLSIDIRNADPSAQTEKPAEKEVQETKVDNTEFVLMNSQIRNPSKTDAAFEKTSSAQQESTTESNAAKKAAESNSNGTSSSQTADESSDQKKSSQPPESSSSAEKTAQSTSTEAKEGSSDKEATLDKSAESLKPNGLTLSKKESELLGNVRVVGLGDASPQNNQQVIAPQNNVTQLAFTIARQVEGLVSQETLTELQDEITGIDVVTDVDSDNLRLLSSESLMGTSSQSAKAVEIKTPASAVGLGGFQKELSDKVFATLVVGKANEVTVKLNPDALGEVKIRMVQEGNNVQLFIDAKQAATGSLLTQNLEALKQTLSDNGLTLTSVAQERLDDKGFEQSAGQGGSGKQQGSGGRETANAKQDDGGSEQALSQPAVKTAGTSVFSAKV
jgi:flagellar hook-length control protein FliK